MSYKNNFFTFDDFLAMLGELRHKIAYYRSEKHTLTLQDVQGLRDDISILNAMLSDIGADLYSDKVSTATTYRHKLLEVTQEKEKELRAGKDEHGKKWTDISNRARYAAELECRVYREEMDKAAAIHELANNFYRVTIPNVLNSISSRIAILIRMMDSKGDFQPMEKQDYGEDNPWAGMDLLPQSGGIDLQMEELDRELDNVIE